MGTVGGFVMAPKVKERDRCNGTASGGNVEPNTCPSWNLRCPLMTTPNPRNQLYYLEWDRSGQQIY